MQSHEVILITGCSSGIGYSTGLLFARKGWRVFAGVRDSKNQGAKELGRIAKEEKLPLTILHLDVTRDTDVKRAVDLVIKKTGRIDVLVNNAGFGYLGAVEDFTIDEVKKQYDVNIYGALRMMKAVIPYMRREKSGRIINITSINGLIPFPLYGIYSSSKFALEALSESIRFEVEPYGIQVLIVEPGVIDTKFWLSRKFPDLKKSLYKEVTISFFNRVERGKFIKRNKQLNHLVSPNNVADRIVELTEWEDPPFRSIVGFDANLLNFLYQMLPRGLWDWLLHKAYKW